MSSIGLRWLWALLAVVSLASPWRAFAQDATLTGVVTDQTGGVLPGVTLVAVHEASGNRFEAVTDERGRYRMPARVGLYRLTAELQGFSGPARAAEVLVGREVVVNFELSPASLQETVTVTGAAPLINTTSSTLGGNIDPRQVSELPVNGRNWMDLTMLAPGSRQNAVSETPSTNGGAAVLDFQLNVDGQQVTQLVATGFGQPRFSRDAIAEFEYIANRFDASYGRSMGAQVNAVTKSGTNNYAGTLSGYFRDDKLNARDFIQKRVLPYSNQQISTTFGGPIRLNRIHFFGNYEFEREPQTFTFDSPFPRFNIDQTGVRTLNTGSARVDFQLSPRTHLTVRASKYVGNLPFDPRYSGGAIRHPSAGISVSRHSNQVAASLTQVIGNGSVNEVRAGYAPFYWDQQSVVSWTNHPAAPTITSGAPQINFIGYTVGQTHPNTPQTLGQEPYSIRNDYTTSFNAAGRHDMKVGGEYIWMTSWMVFCNSCMGIFDAQGGPLPSNIQDLFPVWNDANTWNMAAISPLIRRYQLGIGDFRISNPRHTYGTWLQDNWTVADRLTVNLGVRYDIADGVYAEYATVAPFLEAGRPVDRNNVAPRLGFVYSVNDQTTIRGGWGKFFADVSDQPSLWAVAWGQQLHPEVLNDGRRDFAANPFNGPIPTYDQVKARTCAVTRNAPGCIRPTISTQLISPDAQIPYSYQASVGMQRQLGSVASINADYVYTGIRADKIGRNINLTYNPATGTNYPFTDISRLPFPEFGAVSMDFTDATSDYHALQLAVTKRLSQRWQASGTYSLSGSWSTNPLPILTHLGCKYPMTARGVCDVPVTLAPDLGGERTLAVGDQRHRAVANAIWNIGMGFQLSGLYFFGSGERLATTFGGDRRGQGLNGSARLRPDGSIVPRNNFVGRPLHRVDTRVQRRFALPGRATTLDGMFEVFNLFNH
ncbi:MAG: TonB-dependent receptor domain-containing protein, partial [Mycobacterium sp.]